MSKTRLEWFDGEIYESGDDVVNPLSGETCHLNNEELSVYDYIKGTDVLMSMLPKDIEPSEMYFKALDWFRDNNNDAYMKLLV